MKKSRNPVPQVAILGDLCFSITKEGHVSVYRDMWHLWHPWHLAAHRSISYGVAIGYDALGRWPKNHDASSTNNRRSKTTSSITPQPLRQDTSNTSTTPTHVLTGKEKFRREFDLFKPKGENSPQKETFWREKKRFTLKRIFSSQNENDQPAMKLFALNRDISM